MIERPKKPPAEPPASIPLPPVLQRWLARAPARPKTVNRARPRPEEPDQ